MRKGLGMSLVFACAGGSAFSQVPDLLNALDAGGKAMGAGGAFNATNGDTLASYYNPAGLAYLDRRTVGVALRNLPKSTTRLTGSFENPNLDTDSDSGSRTLTHVGLSLPIRDLFRRGAGNLAISYTVGGYIDDVRTATALSTGALQVNQYREAVKARSDFFTLAYGNAARGGSLTYGVGLIYLRQTVENEAQGVLTQNGQPIDTIDFDSSSTGTGFGAIAGVQYTPPTMPNLSVAASIRTPIDIMGNDETADLYDRVPGRILLAGAYRVDGLRGGRDFLVYGAELGYYFGGKGSGPFDLSSQTTVGVGVEYSFEGFGFGRIPLRAGYRTSSAGGDEFGNRNALTYGVGFRPTRGNYTLDLNFARPEGGGQDLSLWIGYRF